MSDLDPQGMSDGESVLGAVRWAQAGSRMVGQLE